MATRAFDAVRAAMRQYAKRTAPKVQLADLPACITPSKAASLFRSAARLYRAAPWKVFPKDQALVQVTITSNELERAVISVIGQAGQSFGFLIFPSASAFDMYLEVAKQQGKPSYDPQKMPAFLALSFEPLAMMSAHTRTEITKQGWEVSAPSACPSITVMDPGLAEREPTEREVTTLDAVCTVLAELIENQKGLPTLWSGPERSLMMVKTVQTLQGALVVNLRVPPEVRGRTASAKPVRTTPFDIHEEVRDAQGMLDEAWFADYSAELMKRFAESPEGKPLQDPHWSHIIMTLTRTFENVTVAKLDKDGLEHIIFNVFRRQVSCLSEEASGIIQELHAFWRFLDREFKLKHTAQCLTTFDETAVKELHEGLSDAQGIGAAKSLVMQVIEAGIDMSWDEAVESSTATIEMGGTSAPSMTTAQKRAKKAKRKMQRKSRKASR
jgi:hypothetical protein